jgi:hypothetical protein
MRLKGFLMLLRLWKSSSLECFVKMNMCVRMHDTTQMTTSHGICMCAHKQIHVMRKKYDLPFQLKLPYLLLLLMFGTSLLTIYLFKK